MQARLQEKGGAPNSAKERDTNPASRAFVRAKELTNPERHPRGRSVDKQDEKGSTALMRACHGGNVSEVKRLLELGADASMVDNWGYSCLDHVSFRLDILRCSSSSERSCYKEISDLLQKEGLKRKKHFEEHTPLTFAIQTGDEQTAIRLIEMGADIFEPGSKDISPLQLSVILGQKNVVTKLLEYGADVNERTPDGDPLVIFAHSRIEIIRLLIKHGADINSRNSNGETALMRLCNWHEFGNAKKLVKMKADINAVDNEGYSALSRVFPDYCFKILSYDTHSLVKFARWLVAHGADPNTKDWAGATLLMAVCSLGDLDSVRFLIEMGADIQRRDNQGNGVLHWVSWGMRRPNLDKTRLKMRQIEKLLKRRGATG